jgi:tetratricopeptide (TPR) repeat protein
MAGNRQLFEAAMRQGDDSALEEQWEGAIEAYMRAVREFPNSSLACNSLGLALFNAGRLEDALKVYGQAAKLDPSDPLPIEKSGDVLERLGRLNDAARQYLAVAEIYLTHHDLAKAIDNWERATRLTPGMVKINQKLAAAYERLGKKSAAVSEYLKLAFHFQNSANNSQVAMQALERALRLDNKDPRVINAITAVRASRPIDPKLLEPLKGAAVAQAIIDEDPLAFLNQIPGEDQRGPIGEAVDLALERLAEEVFSAGMMDMSAVNAIQGIEMHRAGYHKEAVEGYQRAVEAGMKSPALMVNLASLLYETGQIEPALTFVRRVTGGPVIMAGASHVMAMCLVQEQKWAEAANAILNTFKLVDISLAMDEEETQDLNNQYARFLALVPDADPMTLRDFSQNMAKKLITPGWKRRVAETRNRLADKVAEDPKTALETISKGEGVIEAMERVDRLSAKRHFAVALDECFGIIQQAPDYLAAHLRVAQLLMDTGRVEDATDKYNLVARTYLLRGDQVKSADILNEVLRIAPANIDLRTNLIELLERQERWSEVLDQYIALAKGHRDMADMTNARLTYDLALKLAKQRNAPAEKQNDILYYMAELDMDRLDWRSALRGFQRVLEANPDHLKARRQVVGLHYRLGNGLQGLEDLDKLLQVYARQKRPDLILEILQEETDLNPSDMGLRTRLGTVYQQMNRIPEAIEQFDHLAGLQMEAGLNPEAAKTVRKIISLKPPNVEEYQQVLQQIET